MKAALLLLVFPLAGCSSMMTLHGVGGGPRIVGTGKAIAETRKAEAATTVVTSGAMEVTVRKGPPKLVVSAQKEILKALRTEFKDGRLSMWVEGSSSTDKPIRAEYTGPNVSSLEGSGATSFDATGLGGKTSRIELSGACKAKVEGKVDSLDVEASGASEANLRRLQARDAHVEASGASKVRLWATHSIKAEASGASEIRHAMPVSGPIEADANGASSIAPEK